MSYTDVSGKIILQAFGKFRGTAFVAVEVGDLIGRDVGNDGWILGNQSSSVVVAEAVAIENIAAGDVGWMALAAVIKAPATIGDRGVPSAGVLAASGDVCDPLYLNDAGIASDSAGGNTTQQVGFILSLDRALLMPNVGLTGTDISATTLTLSGLATVAGITLVTATVIDSADNMIVVVKALAEKMTLTAKTDTCSLSAADLLTKVIDGSPTGAATYTLPTATALVAAIEGCANGTSFMFFVNNKASGSDTITMEAGADGTDFGILTVAQNEARAFLVVITDASTEAYVLYGLGT